MTANGARPVRAVSLYPPVVGGLGSVFDSLRSGLAEFGIDLRWLASGAENAAALREDLDSDTGTLVAPESNDGRVRTASLAAEILRTNTRLVVAYAVPRMVETNLVRYLPNSIAKLLTVHNVTPSTYRAARALRDHVHGAVGVSHRIASELIARHRFDAEWTEAIPNAVDISAFPEAPIPSDPKGPLRILTLGRIEDRAKGVLWIPSMVRRAADAGIAVSLTVSGDGPDLEKLKSLCGQLGLDGITTYTGWASRDVVPSLMSSHDVLLFPSRYEGFGIVLIEAMAGFCVPVASAIRDVTDRIVKHGETGLLFPVGDVAAAADRLVTLARDREMLGRLRVAGKAASRSFTTERQAESYSRLIDRILSSPRQLRPPLPTASWEMAQGLQPAWWHPFPEPVKAWARLLRERL